MGEANALRLLVTQAELAKMSLAVLFSVNITFGVFMTAATLMCSLMIFAQFMRSVVQQKRRIV